MSLRYPKVGYFLNSIWRMFFVFFSQKMVGFSKLPASIHLSPNERNEICKMPTALRWYDWCGLMQVWLRFAQCSMCWSRSDLWKGCSNYALGCSHVSQLIAIKVSQDQQESIAQYECVLWAMVRAISSLQEKIWWKKSAQAVLENIRMYQFCIQLHRQKQLAYYINCSRISSLKV